MTQSLPAGGGTVSLPTAVNGQFATVAVAAGAPAGTTITASSSTTAPGSAPAPSAIKRSAEAISGAVPFFFVTFSVSATVTADLFSSESVSLTSSQPATASYYVEFDDITSSPGTKLGCAGPGTVANGVATISNSGATGACTNSGGNTPTLVAGHTYLIQFYYVAAAAPTPTGTSAGASPAASPTSGSTASPTPQPSASASSVVTLAGTSSSYVMLPSLTGQYSGTFTYSVPSPNPQSLSVTYANYVTPATLFGFALPAASPAPSIVYAYITFANTGTPPTAYTWPNNLAQADAQVTIPGLTAATNVVVRMWETAGSGPSSRVCMGNNQSTLLVTPVAAGPGFGTVAFPSPFLASTSTTPGSNCDESNVIPLLPNTAVVVEISNT